jgi:WD40 repeat protein
MGGSLVTVGTRHVKVWRPEGSTFSTPVTSPTKTIGSFFPPPGSTTSQRILQGRNCLLGSLLDGTFTAVVPIGNTQAIVCSESGDICLLDDSVGCQKFYSLLNVAFPITAASLDKDRNLVIAGRGCIITYKLDPLLQSTLNSPANPIGSSNDFNNSLFLCLAQVGKHVVSVDDSRIIRLLVPPTNSTTDNNCTELQLPAHGGPVLGVKPLPSNDVLKASFYTWSTDGTILFWGADGICRRQFNVQLDQPDASEANELKVVRTVPSANVMVTGDKLGVLQILDEKSGKNIYSLRAHAGEITDIAIHDKRSIIASCGRDRTVQVFQRTGKVWELQQTLDEHVGAVTSLLFTNDAKHLISCSSDRTVVVREGLNRIEGGHTLFAFMITRTVTLKATPVSMCLLSGRSDVLLISTIDRCIQKYDLVTGHQLSSFKASDSEGGDAVVLSSLMHLTTINGNHILAGVSSTDKSLRLYDENGVIIARDWGHTEGITDVTTTENCGQTKDDQSHKRLVTVAVDGTIFIWSYGTRSPQKSDISSSMELMGITPTKDILVNKAPLRRVLSQTEMARFRQSSPEQEDANTPTNNMRRSHRPLEKKSSRFSLAQTPKLEPSLSSYDRRKSRVTRSPSPTSPNKRSPPRHNPIQRKASTNELSQSKRMSMSVTARSSVGPGAASNNPSSELPSSTDAICRALRSYRRKLAQSTDNLRPESLREIEKELGLTARAVGEKAIKSKGVVEESVMVKILNQYSERLMEMLDEKFKEISTTGSGKSDSPSGSGAEDENSAPILVKGQTV